MKNNTPYIGKLKLLFEKEPNYRSSDSILNKIHLNLGFVKIVSRLYPKRTLTGWKVDPVKVNLINNNTGGYIRNYDFGGNIILKDSFLSDEGKYIGDIECGWWYYQNNLRVCEEHPRGVAEVWENNRLIGYHGYTHRGGQTFKIGDRVFDSSWVPTFDDIKETWIEHYEMSTGIDVNSVNDEFLVEIVQFVPFNERGSVIIETMDQCLDSTIKLFKFLN